MRSPAPSPDPGTQGPEARVLSLNGKLSHHKEWFISSASQWPRSPDCPSSSHSQRRSELGTDVGALGPSLLPAVAISCPPAPTAVCAHALCVSVAHAADGGCVLNVPSSSSFSQRPDSGY